MTDTNTNNKKTVPSKAHPKVTATLKQALLEFQRLAVTAKKDGKNPHFRSNYSTLESVISAVNQGNQFGWRWERSEVGPPTNVTSFEKTNSP